MSTVDILEQAIADPITSVGEIAARSPLQLFWRRLRGDRVALAALGFIGLLVFVAIFAPLIVKVLGIAGPDTQNPHALDQFGTPTGPSGAHPFGVDQLGRDVFSRTLYGARVSLEVAILATGISVAIGVTMGMIAGYYRGWVDAVLARLMDILLSFPIFLLAIGLASACALGNGCVKARGFGLFLLELGLIVLAVTILYRGYRFARDDGGRFALGDLVGVLAIPVAVILIGLGFRSLPSASARLLKPGLSIVIIVIALANWPYIARIIRGQVLSLREKEFVDAARAVGASNRRIIFREILPNLVAPIIVYGTLIVPQNILFEAALSFLGVGVQPPQASWGQMIADATDIFDSAWWYMLFPGLALLLTVLAFNLVGDGLQDALNPRTSKS
jgi:ABC-type dipeptide/oligopeptide/nickel transport system permease subunit